MPPSRYNKYYNFLYYYEDKSTFIRIRHVRLNLFYCVLGLSRRAQLFFIVSIIEKQIIVFIELSILLGILIHDGVLMESFKATLVRIVDLTCSKPIIVIIWLHFKTV